MKIYAGIFCQTFSVNNPVQWILDARDAGYSEADIRFVLKAVGWLEPLREAIKKATKEGKW